MAWNNLNSPKFNFQQSTTAGPAGIHILKSLISSNSLSCQTPASLFIHCTTLLINKGETTGRESELYADLATKSKMHLGQWGLHIFGQIADQLQTGLQHTKTACITCNTKTAVITCKTWETATTSHIQHRHNTTCHTSNKVITCLLQHRNTSCLTQLVTYSTETQAVTSNATYHIQQRNTSCHKATQLVTYNTETKAVTHNTTYRIQLKNNYELSANDSCKFDCAMGKR